MATREGRGRFVSRPGHRRDRRTLSRDAADGSRREARGRQRHGLTTLKRAVAVLGRRAIDARTHLGRALAAWRRALVDDLGGPQKITTQQAALVDLSVRTKLLVDSVDAFLLTMPSLVNKRRRVLFPVVLQRQALARDLVHTLNVLGLERRTAEPKRLEAYLAEHYGGTPSGPPGLEPGPERRPGPWTSVV